MLVASTVEAAVDEVNSVILNIVRVADRNVVFDVVVVEDAVVIEVVAVAVAAGEAVVLDANCCAADPIRYSYGDRGTSYRTEVVRMVVACMSNMVIERMVPVVITR